LLGMLGFYLGHLDNKSLELSLLVFNIVL